jgi:uncharacterized Ntn-hydrolase superfamily protein
LHLIDAWARRRAYRERLHRLVWSSRGQHYSAPGTCWRSAGAADTASAYERGGFTFAERLLVARGRRRRGGDKRASRRRDTDLHDEDYPFLDLRVDDDEEPFRELRRLYEKSLDRFQPFSSCLPSRNRPAGIMDRAVIEAEVERFQAQRKR